MNRQRMRLKFIKGDFLAIAVVLVLTLVTMVAFRSTVRGQEASTLLIYQDGILIKELPMGVDGEYIVEGDYHNRIEIRDGKAGITQSDCPGSDCVHSGWIHEAGRSIVCLPNRVELRIGGESEVDFVVK